MKKICENSLGSLFLLCALWLILAGNLVHAYEQPADVWLGKWTVGSHYTETEEVWNWWFEVSKTGNSYQIQTHTKGPGTTEILHISENKLEFLFHDGPGTHIDLARDGEKISGTVHQPNNTVLPDGSVKGQREISPKTRETIICIAQGLTSPATGKFPQTVENGDFRITGNDAYKEIGDAYNEQTRWTCSVDRENKYFKNNDIEVAVLNISLVTGKDGWFDTDHVLITGLPLIADSRIHGRKANSRITVEINLLEHYKADDIINTLIGNSGNLNFYYGDDATVAYAKLELGFVTKSSRITKDKNETGFDLTGHWMGRHNWDGTGWTQEKEACFVQDGIRIDGRYEWGGKAGTLTGKIKDNRIEYDYSSSDCSDSGYFIISEDRSSLSGEYNCGSKTGRWEYKRIDHLACDEPILKNLQFVKFSKQPYEEIKEIGYDEPFYIKVEFDSEPQEKEKTVTLDCGEGTDKKIIVKQQKDKKIFLSDTISAKRPTSSKEGE